MQSLTLPAYAKINLGLLIKGKRPDGYHEIETLFMQIDLHDEIRLSHRDDPEITLTCSHPELPADASNLCLRAARLLQHTCKVPHGVAIQLQKNIPIGAGLGGGSSDAAVVLLGLNKLWELGLTAGGLQELGAKLGADVSFFIRGGVALAAGIGEILQPVDFTLPLPIVIVYPHIAISTAEAYSKVNLSLTNTQKNITLAHFEGSGYDKATFARSFQNDFELFVFPEYPLLQRIKDEMYHRGALFASLSGSGSALFGIFHDQQEAEGYLASLEENHSAFMTKQITWGYEDI